MKSVASPATLIVAFMLCFLSHPSYSQSSAHTQVQNSLVPLGETRWNGFYSCLQGQTELHLTMRSSADGSVEALFEFGPISQNADVPRGSFLLNGVIRSTDGFLQLNPVRWILQPPHYVMVGLSGVISGSTYQGSVVGGYRCDQFSVSREGKRLAALPAAPAQKAGTSLIPLQSEGGTFFVPVLINNTLTLNFIIDSGASDVTIPADVVLTLMRTGTLSDSDFLGEQIYRLANGSTVPSQTFRIRSLKVGDKILKGVTGSIASVNGSLLLGQSFLSRFKSWSIDNQRHVLVLK